MTGERLRREVTIGFYPTSRGFGWVAFESPFSVVGSGVFTAKGNKNRACLVQLKRLLDTHRTEALVLEAFHKESSLRSSRIRELCLTAINHAAERGLWVEVYSRADVRKAFATVGARTRDEIAEAVAKYLPCLQHRLPPKRTAWAGEDKRLAIFNAAALVLTHYHNGAAALLDEKRNAA